MNLFHPMNISILYNKPAARFMDDDAHKEAEEDTEHSAIEVANALSEKGMTPTLFPIAEDTIEQTISSLPSDIVFNLIEWTGVDVPFADTTFDLLNARGLLYTGATKESYFISCDKSVTKRMLDNQHLPTATWQLFMTGDEPISSKLSYPVIVKVSNEHSSVGIGIDSIVYAQENLRTVVKQRIEEYHQPVFAEAFLSGREFQVTLLETEQGLQVLPPAEIVYAKHTNVPLLTYESRWDEAHNDYSNSQVTLASLSPQLEHDIIEMSTSAFTLLKFRDYARFDIRCDEQEHPYFLELNSNPGLGDDPEYGMTVSYKALGMTFSDFVWAIVQSTLRRNVTG